LKDDPCKKEREAEEKATREYSNARKVPLPPQLPSNLNNIKRDVIPETMEKFDLREKLRKEEEELREAWISAQEAHDECKEKHGLM
jgi:hypothetical protein